MVAMNALNRIQTSVNVPPYTLKRIKPEYTLQGIRVAFICLFIRFVRNKSYEQTNPHTEIIKAITVKKWRDQNLIQTKMLLERRIS